MKNFTVKALAMALVFVCAAVLSSCSCSRDKKNLLSCVPADTAGVALLDFTNLWDQLEIKIDGDDVSYCSEIKDLLKLGNLKSKEIGVLDDVLRTIDGTAKSIVIFEYDDAIWGTFFVEDGDDFIKFLEDEGEADFDKEEGYKVWEQIAVKGDQVWLCVDTKNPDDGIDTEKLDKLRDLGKDKRFDKKYEKIAEYMLAENVVSSYCVNIDKCLDYMGNYDRQQANMVLGMAFKDAKFLVGQTKLDDKEYVGELRVLDDRQEPAEFTLPMAKIEAAGLSKLNNDSPLVAAIAINPELAQKIKGLAEKLNGGLSSSDQGAPGLFGALSGTSGLSFASASDGVCVINFNNADTPVQVGAMFNRPDSKIDIATAGNMLIARLSGTPASGKGQAPSKLVGQYFGIYIDGSKEGGKLISGYDLSKLGKMWLTVGPDGKGVKMQSGWDVKNPVRTMLKEIMVLAQGFMTNSITAPGIKEFEDKYMTSYSAAAVDSVYVYDDYYYDEMMPDSAAVAYEPVEAW